MEVKKKYQRPQLEVTCGNPECCKTFKKDGSEVRRNKKLGRRNYCSLKCSGKVNSTHLDKKGCVENFKGKTGKRDEFTGLREHFHRVKKRDKVYDITLDDLLVQWNEQDGICPYTGIKLIHPKDAGSEILYNKASLDRIDSSKGYIKCNIQFISASANLAKSTMTDEEMINFCKLISEHWR
tara:strand:+ start:787 stop:1329 length:543 start_codon:yes stop_codon:yes gene_type:complete